mgnify:FL=1
MAIEVGNVFEGRVTGVKPFGAFVALPEGRVGMVHISEVSNEFVQDINTVLHDGDEVKVQVINIAPDGKIALSIKRTQPAPERGHRPQGGGNGPSAGPAHADTEPHAGKVTGRLLQQLPDGIRLMGVMPLIAGEQYAVVSRVQGHCFDGGGPHIHAEAQNIRIDMCHIHSF